MPQFHRLSLWCAAVMLALSAGAVSAAPPASNPKATADQPPALDIKPGQEIKVDDAQTGHGFFQLYCPQDYTPDREWPCIFFFHGIRNEAMTWPFRDATGGRGFIIVGMDYVVHEEPSADRDIANVKRIAGILSQSLKINPRLMYLSGFSQGGFATITMGERSPELWAGLLIFGAGRDDVGMPPTNLKALAGKPIFVGIGETDPSHASAVTAASFYRKCGAEVTFEEFPGLAHMVDPGDAKLKEWLHNNGPAREARMALASADAAEKAGKIAEAYAIYARLARSESAGPEKAAAEKAAGAIEEQANKKLAAAEADIAAKRYTEASRTLAQAAMAYAKTPMGEKAEKRLTALRTDPTILAEIEQAKIDTAADALESQAQTAEKAKHWDQALAFYEQYVHNFAKARRFAEVKAHLDALKADKSIQAAATGQQADAECKNWMAMAENYIAAKMPAKAKPYLKQIIDKYGGTEWGAKAKALMAQVEKEMGS